MNPEKQHQAFEKDADLEWEDAARAAVESGVNEEKLAFMLAATKAAGMSEALKDVGFSDRLSDHAALSALFGVTLR